MKIKIKTTEIDFEFENDKTLLKIVFRKLAKKL